MNNRKIIIGILLILCLSNCFCKEIKGSGNPDIGKIIKISNCKITSEETEKTIIPSFEFYIEKKENVILQEVGIDINYIFGQDLKVIYSKLFLLDNSSIEIEELNKNNKCIIKVKLDPIAKETILKKNAYGLINEERVSIMFNLLKYQKSSVWKK